MRAYVAQGGTLGSANSQFVETLRQVVGDGDL
jgi:hypothetical protein